MIEIVEFLDSKGSSLFAKWFDGLNAQAAAKIATYITRIENGNFSSLKSIGQGVHESRIDWGLDIGPIWVRMVTGLLFSSAGAQRSGKTKILSAQRMRG
jgi:putative addiction module killer protein